MSREAALGQFGQLFGATAEFESWLEACRTWPGVEALYRHIGLADDLEMMLDHLATLRYGLVFTGLGFEVECEPQGPSGPDLAVERAGVRADVEVTRFRAVNPGPPNHLSPLGTLSQFGNPRREVGRAMRKISRKFKQLQGERTIVAVWNDDEALMDIEVRFAAKSLEEVPDLPPGLQAIIYGGGWIHVGEAKEFCTYALRDPDEHVQGWLREFEMITQAGAIKRALAG